MYNFPGKSTFLQPFTEYRIVNCGCFYARNDCNCEDFLLETEHDFVYILQLPLLWPGDGRSPIPCSGQFKVVNIYVAHFFWFLILITIIFQFSFFHQSIWWPHPKRNIHVRKPEQTLEMGHHNVFTLERRNKANWHSKYRVGRMEGEEGKWYILQPTSSQPVPPFLSLKLHF